MDGSGAPDLAMAAFLDEDSSDVRAAAAGDAGAFERLYRRHASRLNAVLWRLAGGVEARAEDWLQEAFVRAWQQLPGFRFESRFGTWLHRLAVNTALMQLRSLAARPEGWIDADADDASLHGGGADRPDLRHDLERAIGALPERARAVLVLHDIEGWQHQEIAEAMGTAVGTSKAQLHRARGLLRAQLEDPS
ncbi:MAG: sigma-70 family RNA polymerase sigma factor [Xanthomonadales bacterium]|nr:sigma-70 family RNA polymerase sigma factor [Xanthomonadales bacterium]